MNKVRFPARAALSQQKYRHLSMCFNVFNLYYVICVVETHNKSLTLASACYCKLGKPLPLPSGLDLRSVSISGSNPAHYAVTSQSNESMNIAFKYRRKCCNHEESAHETTNDIEISDRKIKTFLRDKC